MMLSALVLLAVLSILLLGVRYNYIRQHSLSLPPGPTPFPLVGNILGAQTLLDPEFHRNLMERHGTHTPSDSIHNAQR